MGARGAVQGFCPPGMGDGNVPLRATALPAEGAPSLAPPLFTPCILRKAVRPVLEAERGRSRDFWDLALICQLLPP